MVDYFYSPEMSYQNVNIFPEEVRRALDCIADESRQKIISALINEHEFAYTELKNSLELTKGNMNHHLSELLKAGLISKYLKGKSEKPYESYYSLSDFGRDFVVGTLNALKPSQTAESVELGTERLFEILANPSANAAQGTTKDSNLLLAGRLADAWMSSTGIYINLAPDLSREESIRIQSGNINASELRTGSVKPVTESESNIFLSTSTITPVKYENTAVATIRKKISKKT